MPFGRLRRGETPASGKPQVKGFAHPFTAPPTTFYLICTSLAKSMMMSGLVLIFTGGASLNTTANIDTMISYMYKQSVNNLNYNKGYAAAIIAFLMTFVVMLISFRFEKKGVHYS